MQAFLQTVLNSRYIFDQSIFLVQFVIMANFKPVAAGRLGVVASVVRRMNEVTVRRARLVLGWMTVYGRVYHHGM